MRPKDAPPAAYVEQRTRLGIGYKNKWLTLWMQPQDVRVWGSEQLVNVANSKFTLFQG